MALVQLWSFLDIKRQSSRLERPGRCYITQTPLIARQKSLSPQEDHLVLSEEHSLLT